MRERETERKVFLFRWFTPQKAPTAGVLRRSKARSQVLLLVSHVGAGPKDLGHPPLHSRATAESWIGRGATGTRTRGAGAARQRISLLSHGAGLFLFLTGRVDSERERDREKGLPLPLVHPPMAAAAGASC